MNEKIGRIMQDLFGLSPDQLSDELSMNNLPGWDSVNHLTLMLSIENAFGVQFSPEMIQQLNSVAKIRVALQELGAS